MQVRMKIGPKAGQMVDLPYSAARNLVEMDQAEDLNDQMRLAKPKVVRIDALSIEGKGISNEAISASVDDEKIPVAEHASKKKRK